MPKPQHQIGIMRLYDPKGRRLYLNTQERNAFIDAASRRPLHERSFLLFLVFTGCRLSEARNLRLEDLQIDVRSATIRTLKRKDHVREVPIPRELATMLQAQCLSGDRNRKYVWNDIDCPPPRPNCYRLVKSVMAEIGVSGPKACARGLRHAFGVHAVLCGIQLHMLQKWMGHASMTTTAIYATVVGKEERKLAALMWPKAASFAEACGM